MKTKETFSLQIDAIFDIHGQGIIVTGRVETGKIKTGDLLKIYGNNIELNTKCLKLQKYLRQITEAAAGEYIGITLSDVSKSQISRGMQLSSD